MATHAPKMPQKLQQNYAIPSISHVSAARPLHWLKDGWQDFLAHPGPSMMYGFIVAAVSWMILTLAAPKPYLVSSAISGFLLVAPLLAAGIYELTREREAGTKVSFMESVRGLRRNAGTIADYSVVLVIMAIVWERAGAIIFALSYGGEMHTIEGFVREIFLSGDYIGVAVGWLAGGLALAGFVFSLTVVGMPMVIDRNIDVVTAMGASLKTVKTNMPAMFVWALVIVGLSAVGLVGALALLLTTKIASPLLVCAPLAITMPLLGHATWAAYKDLVH